MTADEQRYVECQLSPLDSFTRPFILRSSYNHLFCHGCKSQCCLKYCCDSSWSDVEEDQDTKKRGASWCKRWLGRLLCMSGPDWLTALMSMSLIGVPGVVVIVRIIPYFSRINPIIGIVYCFLFLLNIGCGFRTCFMDPGILPKSSLSDNQNNDPFKRPPPLIKSQVCGTDTSLKFCDTCYLYRSPGTHHCSTCGNCVERFDHHCPWMGNCIAKRNYRYFVSFLVLTVFNSFTTIALCCVHLVLLTLHDKERNSYSSSGLSSVSFSSLEAVTDTSEDSLKSLGEALKTAPDSLIIGAYAAIGVWSIVGLTCYHLSLIFRGLTTNEDLKRSIKGKANSGQTTSWYGNFFRTCCGPLHISYFASQPQSSWVAVTRDIRFIQSQFHAFTVPANSLTSSNTNTEELPFCGKHFMFQEEPTGKWIELNLLSPPKNGMPITSVYPMPVPSTSNS